MTDRIEAAARALHDWVNDGNSLTWDDLDRLGREEYLRAARAVLAAADTADHENGVQRLDRAALCLDRSAALMGVIAELEDIEDAEMVTQRAMQWEADAKAAAGAGTPGETDSA